MGAFLRLYNLGNLSLTIDEIYNAICMKSILQEGFPILPNGHYYTRGLTQSYLGAMFAFLFGANEMAIRLPSAIAGIGLIILLYLIGKEFKDSGFGLVVSAAIAFFPWAIEFSRWGRMYCLLSFFVVSSFYFAFTGFKYQNNKKIGISVLLALLSPLTHPYGMLAPLLVLACYIASKQNIKSLLLSKKIYGLVILSGLLFPIINIVVYLFIQEGNPAKVSMVFLNSYQILSTLKFSPFFLQYLFQHHTVLILGIILFSASLLYHRQTANKNLLLLLVGVCPVIFVSLYHVHYVTRYLFFAMPLLMVVGFLGYYVWIQKISESRLHGFHFKKAVPSFVTAILILFTFAEVTYSFAIPFRKHGDLYENPYYAPTLVSNYIADRRSNNEFTIKQIKPGDILITDSFHFFYYYTSIESDYFIRPGPEYFCDKNKNGCKVRYFSKTYLLNEKKQLFNIINSTDSNIYFVLNLKGNHDSVEKQIIQWLKEAAYYFSDNITIQKMFTGEEPYAIVFKISKS